MFIKTKIHAHFRAVSPYRTPSVRLGGRLAALTT